MASYQLSVFNLTRLLAVSACTCPGEEHPGPSISTGRGAPEIDVLEAEMNKITGVGQVVSQSAQFAPFAHDYVYLNSTPDQFTIYNTSITSPNTYRGSPLYVPFDLVDYMHLIHGVVRQQAVSTLTQVPDNMFQGSGQQFVTFGVSAS
jgi:beta-glucan synthesis-associated protein KRE6